MGWTTSAAAALVAGLTLTWDLQAAIEAAHSAKTALRRNFPTTLAQVNDAIVPPVRRERPVTPEVTPEATSEPAVPTAPHGAETPPGAPSDQGLLGSVQDWLARANREYQGTVIRELSLPPSGEAAITRKLQEDRQAEAARRAAEAEQKRAAEQQPPPAEPTPAPAPDADAARLADEMRIEREKLEAEAARIETERKAAEEKRLAEEHQRAEQAKRARAERLAAEEKRKAEEAARLEAERKATEDAQETRLAEEKRLAEERQRTEEAKRADEARRLADAAHLEAERLQAERKAAAAKAAAEKAEAERLAEERRVAEERRIAEAKREADEAATRRTERAEVEAPEISEAPKAASPPTAQPSNQPSEESNSEPPPASRAASIEYSSYPEHVPACPNAGRKVSLPGRYIVAYGDNLWNISKRHYRKGRFYRAIYRANRRKIRKPSLIYPCQRLYVPRWRA